MHRFRQNVYILRKINFISREITDVYITSICLYTCGKFVKKMKSEKKEATASSIHLFYEKLKAQVRKKTNESINQLVERNNLDFLWYKKIPTENPRKRWEEKKIYIHIYLHIYPPIRIEK